MRKKPDDEALENLYFRQLDKAEQLKQLVVVYIQDAGQKLEAKSFPTSERMVNH